MAKFKLHSIESAPQAAKELLERSQKQFGGMIPNLHRVMAESPALLEAYQALGAIFEKTDLTNEERNVLWLTVSFENGCTYCMAAHTAVAKHAGVTDADIEALRSGEPLQNPKLQALRKFTATVVETRGWVDNDSQAALLAAGYTAGNILDVILVVGMKTLSNYTNHVTHTPNDEPFEKFAWSKP